MSIFAFCPPEGPKRADRMLEVNAKMRAAADDLAIPNRELFASIREAFIR